MKTKPIGIFDSGVGGTSIWREVQKLLPGEDTIYLSDSKNAPYGEKSPSEIIQLCIKNTELLLQKDCKIIVVACNTATTNAISYLRQNYPIKFIGIEPAIKPAALHSKTGRIGVLATKGTLASDLFLKTSKDHASDVLILEKEGKGLVKLIEEGKVNSIETRALLEKYLDPMVAEEIDHLVLGCTHYPYLIPVLNKILPEDVTVIDCSGAVARQTRRVLEDNDLLSQAVGPGRYEFFTNGDQKILKEVLADSAFPLVVAYRDF